MQLHDLVKPMDQMTDEELEERLRNLRHRRDVVRPAAKKHVERAEKKGSQSRVNKVADLFDGMTEEQKLELLQILESGE